MLQFTDYSTIIGCGFIIILTTIIILKKSELNISNTIFYSLWILIFLIPIVSFKQTYIPTLEYWEHRAYIIFIGMILLLSEILNVIKVNPKKMAIVFSILLIILIPISIVNSNNFSSSYNFFNNIISKGSTLPNAYYSRASILKDRGDLNESLNDLNMAIELDNSYFEAYFKRGVIYQSYKNFDFAINDYKKVITLKPDFADSYMNLGYCYYYKKDLKNANKCIDKVLKINPSDKDAQRIKVFLNAK